MSSSLVHVQSDTLVRRRTRPSAWSVDELRERRVPEGFRVYVNARRLATNHVKLYVMRLLPPREPETGAVAP